LDEVAGARWQVVMPREVRLDDRRPTRLAETGRRAQRMIIRAAARPLRLATTIAE
jgi:hypothetical protein